MRPQFVHVLEAIEKCPASSSVLNVMKGDIGARIGHFVQTSVNAGGPRGIRIARRFFKTKRTVRESIKQSLCRVHYGRSEHEHKH